MTKEQNYDLENKKFIRDEKSNFSYKGFNMIPYSLSPNQMELYFGFKSKAIYDLIYSGRLHRGYHYLKVGKKVVVICDKFIEWMEENDGSKSTR